MKKGTAVLKILIVISALFCMMQMASCNNGGKKLPFYSASNGRTSVELVRDDEIIFNLVVSESIKESLQKKYPEIYDSFSQYFNVMSDNCIDSNTIYIHAATNNFEGLFSAYDEKLYNLDKEDLCLDSIGSLSYKDYYVGVNDDCVMIVCGSEETLFNTLQNLSENNISKSVSDSDIENYLMDIPITGFYYGDYLNGASIAQNQIQNYNLIYPSTEFSGEGKETAKYIYDYFYQNYDVDLHMSVSDYSGDYPYEIVVGNTAKEVCLNYYSQNPDIFSYKIVQSEDKLYIMGGSEWALKYAADILIDEFFSQCKNIPANYTTEGNIYGVHLFEDYEGSNLRLMSQNVWGYEINSPAWQTLNMNCSLASRMDEFAGVFMAYKPDALCLQEIRSSWYAGQIVKMMNEKGNNYELVDCNEFQNHTPIIYNKDTLTLHESGFYRFPTWYIISKSYTWARFTHNETGEEFVLVSTHLWHKSVKSDPNSEMFRINELTDINTLVERCISEFDVPCFVMGDFNCTTVSNEFKYTKDLGFSQCYDLATEYADNSRGRFVCNQNVFSNKPTKGSYKKNAIDHALVKNNKDSNILVYDYVTPNFYGTLSDHAALYIDVNL